MRPCNWQAVGSSYGFLAVAMGAFGAHALKDRLDEPMRAVYRTAVEFQFYHALALVLVGVLTTQRPSAVLTGAGYSFALGVALFSGSLYALSLSGASLWGAVTPLGGLLFLVGWGLLAWNAIRIPRP